MKQIQLSYEIYQDVGPNTVKSMWVPSKKQICDQCEGEGKMDNPAFSNGFSQEELDDDPEFKERYFDGAYDVRCDCCGGRGMTDVMAVDRMTFAQKRFAVLFRRDQIEKAQFEREYAAECAAERRFGC